MGQTGLFRRTTDPSNRLASVLTSRLINIPTDPTTQVVTGSATTYLQVFNVGPSTIAWGDSSITASSGGILFYSMSEIFNPTLGGFSFYVIADSVQGTIVVNELG